MIRQQYLLLRFVFISLFIAPLICLAQIEGIAKAPDGAPIFYRVFGSGKPLLIINGGPGMNSEGFAGLASTLSKDFKAIIYDQRGTGRSVLQKLDTSTITMQKMIEDIEALREHLHIQTLSVLGHSFGGMVASYYATQHPERIDRLVLSSSGGVDLELLSYVPTAINKRLTEEERKNVSYWTNEIANGDTSYFARLKRGMNLAPAYVYDRKFVPVIAERLTQGNQTINRLIWSNLQAIHFNCAPKLKNYSKPVLIIQGKQDIVSPATAERSHKAFINSRVVYVTHSVHYGWLDNPEEYFSQVITFLKKS